MRRILILGVIIVLAAMPAFSQPMTGKFELGALGGINMPTGDLGDGMDKGYMVGVNAGFRPMPLLVIGAEVAYYGNGATDDVLALLGTGADMSMNIWQYTAMAKLMAPLMGNHNIYAKGLVGAYNATAKLENIPLLGNLEASDTNLGFGIGGGLRINGVSKSSFFVEGMFQHINGEGASAEFFTVAGGILFSLP